MASDSSEPTSARVKCACGPRSCRLAAVFKCEAMIFFTSPIVTERCKLIALISGTHCHTVCVCVSKSVRERERERERIWLARLSRLAFSLCPAGLMSCCWPAGSIHAMMHQSI